MSLKEKIKALMAEKKSIDEVLSTIVDEFPKSTEQEILDAIESVQKGLRLAKSISDKADADKKKIDDQKKVEQEKEDLKSVAKDVVDEALKDIKNAQSASSVTGSAKIGHDYKSFLKDIVVLHDGSWHEQFKELVVACSNGDKSKALEISDRFRKSSKLFGEKVLRGDATTGSYATPDEFSDMVFAIPQRDSHTFASATKLSMSSDKMYLLGSGDVTFTEVSNQATALTESEPAFTQTALDLIDTGAFTYIHDNLIADSNVNIVNVLAQAYGRGLLKYIKRATTVGNVASSGDKFNGIYSTSGIGSVAVADPSGNIAYDDIVDLIGAIDEVFLDGAHFEMNRRELLKIMKLKDGQGRPLFSWPVMNGEPATILGYPVYWNNQMPITLDSSSGNRTTGDTASILFFNPSQVQIGIKGGFEFDSSIHFKFTNRQTTFRGFMRWAQTIVIGSSAARLIGIK